MSRGSKGNVLIVDDEPNALKVLSAILSEDGYDILESNDVDSATRAVRKEDVDAVITDLKMPGKDGLHLFTYLSEHHSDIPVIFLTAYGTVESAVSAMTRGAFYYFIKPPDYPKLKAILAKAVEQRCLKRELQYLKKRLSEEGRYHLIGNTSQMSKISETIETVKDSASNILICGETGTGKEVIARAIHFGSAKKDMPFVAFNCAAMPRELIESELFGYEKGAFTGAHSRRIGRFEEASSGTIFLDEIGEIEPSFQAKLLRVIEEREIERLGSNNKIKVGFRLISSTNRNLENEVRARNFREDLLYRINVVQIDVQPLRERSSDIVLFVEEFLKEFCARENKVLTVSDEVMKIFNDHSWPGNIRQLKNVIERAVVLAKGDEITPKELPKEFRLIKSKPFEKENAIDHAVKTLREIEIEAARNALEQCKGNKSKAAKSLGISRKALYRKLNEFNIS